MGVKGSKMWILMLFCHFNEKKIQKTHFKLLRTLFCFHQGAVFNIIVPRTSARYYYVPKRSVAKAAFSGVTISGSIWNRNNGSSVLYSPWASDHLYSHKKPLDYYIYFLIHGDILNAWNRSAPRPRVLKSRYSGETLQSPSTAVTQRSFPTCSVANCKR